MQNTLYTGDNLYILHGMNSESVDLIYLDPPFNSKRLYSAPVGSKAAGSSFKDMWTWEDVDEYYLESLTVKHPSLVHFIESISKTHSKDMMAYITYMTERVLEMHRVLKNTGSFYFHCDTTASHYVKIMLDEIFGRNNFRNEIIWCYRGGGYPRNDFGRRHDVIFRYSKSDNYCFNVDDVRIPYSDIVLNSNPSRYDKSYRKNFVYEGYKPNELGKHPEDWWEIQPIAPSAKERTGYPTQKPLKLLERIIKASSKPGDVVLDPFCGCATTCVAAEHLGRKWIGVDIAEKSADLLIERLTDAQGTLFKNFINLNKPPVRTDIEILEITAKTKKDIKNNLYKDQSGHCGGCQKEFEVYHLEIDHIIPKAKGGGDYFENYQLLCSNCNRLKGARPMDYLRMKIDEREKLLKNRIRFGE